MKLNYKNDIKKIFFSPSRYVYKLNDYTNESFWGRTGQTNDNRTAIIIGVGSVGGLVLDYLCKSGFKKIIIYDDDIFDVINTPRHVLGIKNNEIGSKKVTVLFEHYSNLYPMIEFEAKDEKFKYNSKVPNNSLIFNTTGGAHLILTKNLLLLFEANKNKQFCFVDIFVEPFALGIHGIVFNNTDKQSKEKQSLKYLEEERYIVTSKKDFRKNFDGCFTPTIPYGFAPLQIAIPWLITIMSNNNYKEYHYTIPFLSLFKDKKNILNEHLSSKINPYRIGVKIWRK